MRGIKRIETNMYSTTYCHFGSGRLYGWQTQLIAHSSILDQGISTWNDWRSENSTISPNLSGVELRGRDLSGADFADCDLRKADLREAILDETLMPFANLTGARLDSARFRHGDLYQANLMAASLRETSLVSADLSNATLYRTQAQRADFTDATMTGTIMAGADLGYANLSHATLLGANISGTAFVGADLSKAVLTGANLSGSDLSNAKLRSCNLNEARLVQTSLKGANLSEARVYGASVWDVETDEKTKQTSLIITPEEQPTVTVDDIEVAQFVYLLLNNKKIRNVLDTIGRKGVLILGRFTPERKVVLDGLRERLREMNYVPMMFDFEGAKSKDFTETIKILAGMSRFIIADITNPKSSPLELQAAVPDYMIPFVPVIQEDEEPFSMFANLQNKYDWVLDVLVYKDAEQLLAVVDKAVIQPALAKEDELIPRKAEEIRKRYAEDYH